MVNELLEPLLQTNLNIVERAMIYFGFPVTMVHETAVCRTGVVRATGGRYYTNS